MDTQSEEKFPFEKEEADKKRLKTVDPIPLEHGLIATRDNMEEWRFAEMLLSSKALPKSFENVPQVFVALQFLKSHGVPPALGFRNLMIFNGVLNSWGEFPKALCEKSGLLQCDDEFWFDKDYKEISFANKNLNTEVYGAHYGVTRKDRQEVIRCFTVDDAKIAGLWNSKDTWKKYPKRMLQLRARSWGLKDVFPDVLLGLSIAEYDHDLLPGGAMPETKSLTDDPTDNELYSDGEKAAEDKKPESTQ